MKSKASLLKEAVKLNEEKRYEEADALLTDELLKKYKDVPLYAEKAMALWYLKKYEDCESLVNIAFQLDKNNAKINNYLGAVNWNKKEYEKTISFYEKAIAIDPKFVRPYYGLGNVYKDKNEYEKAIKNYEKAIELEPLFSYPYNNLGLVYYYKNEYEKAIKNYEKSIELDPFTSAPHYNLGLVYFKQKEYEKAKLEYQKSIELENDLDDYFSKIAKSRLEEIEIILKSKPFENITDLVKKIKNLLLFKKSCITHYTGISTAQFLIIKDSPLRLSEGAFLNDTSEGRVLFEYLNFQTSIQNSNKVKANIFTKKPFIGSFVHESKNNDLTLWRMYGKENLEEAKGCAITLDVTSLKDDILEKLNLKRLGDSSIQFEELEFYKVAYQNEKGKFTIPDATTKEINDLEKALGQLKKEIENYNQKEEQDADEKLNITELLNEIAYLFKNAEYQYENEVRLLFQEAIGFEKHIDLDYNPPKVYIELVPIKDSISSITIGPKVERAEEWASAFHYHLAKSDLEPEIQISRLPFK